MATKLRTAVDSVPIVRCGVGGESFTIEMSAVASVQVGGRLKRASAPTDDGRIGTIAGGGSEIAVYGLADLLGLGDAAARGSAEDQREHVLVLHSDQGMWGCLVESVSRVVQVRRDRISPLPSILTSVPHLPFHAVTWLDEARDHSGNGGTVGRKAEEPGFDALFASLMTPNRQPIALLLSPRKLHPHVLLEGLMAPDPEVPAHSPARKDKDNAVSGLRSEAPAPHRPGTRNGKSTRKQVFLFTPEGMEGSGVRIVLSVTQVLEIHEPPAILNVPLGPPHLLGLVPWREHTVPVVDLGFRLGLTSIPGEVSTNRLVICRSTGPDPILAFPIHPGVRSLQVPFACREAVPPPRLKVERTRGLYLWEDTLLVVPDLASM